MKNPPPPTTQPPTHSKSNQPRLAPIGYDAASRLLAVTNGTHSVTYEYATNSSLLAKLTQRESGAVRLTRTQDYDYVNCLTRIESKPTASPPSSFAYQYNDLNQRARVDLADGSSWSYAWRRSFARALLRPGDIEMTPPNIAQVKGCGANSSRRQLPSTESITLRSLVSSP